MGVNYDELVRRLRKAAGWRGAELDFDGDGAEKVSKETIEWQAADAIESLQRYANRYRWLRAGDYTPEVEKTLRTKHGWLLMDDELDNAIDEAMRESNRP